MLTSHTIIQNMMFANSSSNSTNPDNPSQNFFDTPQGTLVTVLLIFVGSAILAGISVSLVNYFCCESTKKQKSNPTSNSDNYHQLTEIRPKKPRVPKHGGRYVDEYEGRYNRGYAPHNSPVNEAQSTSISIPSLSI